MTPVAMIPPMMMPRTAPSPPRRVVGGGGGGRMVRRRRRRRWPRWRRREAIGVGRQRCVERIVGQGSAAARLVRFGRGRSGRHHFGFGMNESPKKPTPEFFSEKEGGGREIVPYQSKTMRDQLTWRNLPGYRTGQKK
jgi:hypothetical protein